MPFGIGAYDEAAPLSGNVPPSLIDLLVTPGAAAPAASAPTAATEATSSAASTAESRLLMDLSLNEGMGLNKTVRVLSVRVVFFGLVDAFQSVLFATTGVSVGAATGVGRRREPTSAPILRSSPAAPPGSRNRTSMSTTP